MRPVTAIVSLPIVAATILRKAAADEGFDIDLGAESGWLRFESTQTPAAIAVTANDAVSVLAVSAEQVANELAREAIAWGASPLPRGMAAAFVCETTGTLYHLLARTRMLGRSLPAVPLVRFVEESKALPRSTEAERLVVQRVGQDIFRQALLDYWDGRCPITGIDDRRLLRASHIKPWAKCESDAERLDIHNGLLLAAHLDAAFDSALISFADNGAILFSPAFAEANRTGLGLTEKMALPNLTPQHRERLAWHRDTLFAKVAEAPEKARHPQPCRWLPPMPRARLCLEP